MQVVYVLQISDDIDKPVACASELHARDRAAIAAHDRGVTLDPWVTGDDGGFLWRMETWWRMEESDGGVYVQSEAVSLTRDIPTGLGWMIGPFVTSIPKETLAFTLDATKKAVTALK